MAFMQCAVGMIYPDQRVLCSKFVDDHGALCGAFWRDIPFQTGHSCDLCGDADGAADSCDDCLKRERPWKTGRVALAYRDAGRVLYWASCTKTELISLRSLVTGWLARAPTKIRFGSCAASVEPSHKTPLQSGGKAREGCR